MGSNVPLVRLFGVTACVSSSVAVSSSHASSMSVRSMPSRCRLFLSRMWEMRTRSAGETDAAGHTDGIQQKHLV